MQLEVIKRQMKKITHFNEGYFLPEKGCQKSKYPEISEGTKFAQGVLSDSKKVMSVMRKKKKSIQEVKDI